MAATLALNMIIKDEEDNLPKVLESVKGIVDEMVIVDTGSKDRSVEIAKSYGATVIDFKWIDDFSAARNKAKEKTKSAWILTLDADEYLLPPSQEKLKELKQRLDSNDKAYNFTRCMRSDGNATLYQPKIYLFPNRDDLRWKLRAHEQISLDFEELGIGVIAEAISVENERTGESKEEREKKTRYYYELLHKDLVDFPGTGVIYYHLGKACFILKKYDEAIEQLSQALDTLKENSTLFFDLTFYLVSSLYTSGRRIEAWAALKNAQELYPYNCALLDFEAVILRVQKKWEEAEALYHRIIETSDQYDVSILQVDPKIARTSARLNLADLYLEINRPDDAKKMWQAVLEDFPENRIAREGLKKRTE